MSTAKILNGDDEEEKAARHHEKRLRYARYAFAQVKEAIDEIGMPLHYLLEGVYYNGETPVSVEVSGSSLEDCVRKLKDADPTFGRDEISFTGGWVCPEYDVTKQVRKLV